MAWVDESLGSLYDLLHEPGALADTLLDVSVRLAGDHAAVLRGARAPLEAFSSD